MAFPPLPTQVRCPNCKTPFVVDVLTIIDVSDDPELKNAFLRGRVNYAECPQCHAGGMLSAPLLYHDASKELLVSFVPPELGMSNDQQEKFIGGLVKAVMDSLPSEQRKGYFFRPKTALTFEGLYDLILEADGISKEALEAQRAKMRLVNQLLAVLDDEEDLKKLVEEQRTQLTYEFFLLLSNLVDAAEEDGDSEQVAALQQLREKLLAQVNLVVPQAANPNASFEQLLELLESAQDGNTWRGMVALNRARLDYAFFQALTGKIEAAQNAGDTQTAEHLTQLRARIVAELDRMNQALRQVEDQASFLIMQLMEASDLAAALRENKQDLNEVVLGLLSRYEAVARSKNDTARAEKFHAIIEAALDVLEEELPPEARLLNKLMRADYPDGTNAVLEEHRGLLNEDFVKLCDQYIEELSQGTDTELAEHLKQIRGQIVAKMSVLRP